MGILGKSKPRSKPVVDTTASVATVEQAQDIAAVQPVTAPVLSQPQKPTSNGAKMSDSILTFSEDVSTQEPPSPLPAGDYPATIKSAEKKVSTSSGNEYIALMLMVSPDHYPADFTDGNADGEVLSYNRLVVEDTPRARYRIRKVCEAIGAKASKEIDLAEWLGLTATITVTQDEYEGEKRAQIKAIKGAA